MPAETPDQSLVTWRDGVPVSTRYDDPYYSLEDGLAEAAHVFIAGNGLPDRFRDGFHMAELGFGTGLNLVAACRAWRAAGCEGSLHFTSFEAFPLSPETALKALERFPDSAPWRAVIVEALSTDAPVSQDFLRLTVIRGDARETLPCWTGRADAWCLDGFAPARNPELWEPPLLRAVANHTVAGGTLATYSAAGHVRRALSEAGFTVTRQPGFGRKRHMTTGVLA